MQNKTSEEIAKSMAHVDRAVAQQRLEGLTVSVETVEELRKVARGEITLDESWQNFERKYNHGAPRTGQ